MPEPRAKARRLKSCPIPPALFHVIASEMDYDQNCVIVILALTHRFRTLVEKLSAIFLDRITFNCGMADVSYISKAGFPE